MTTNREKVAMRLGSAFTSQDAKEWWKTLEAGRGEKGPSPGTFRESTALLTPWFQSFGLRTCEGIYFCCLKPLSLCHSVTAFLEG